MLYIIIIIIMASGNYQLAVAAEDRDKTAFVTKVSEGTFLEECYNLSGLRGGTGS